MDDPVQSAERMIDIRRQGIEMPAAGSSQIQRQCRGFGAGAAAQGIVQLVQLRLISTVQHDGRTVYRAGHRHGSTDAARGPGHEDDAAKEQIGGRNILCGGHRFSRIERAQLRPLRTAASSVAGYSLRV